MPSNAIKGLYKCVQNTCPHSHTYTITTHFLIHLITWQLHQSFNLVYVQKNHYSELYLINAVWYEIIKLHSDFIQSTYAQNSLIYAWPRQKCSSKCPTKRTQPATVFSTAQTDNILNKHLYDHNLSASYRHQQMNNLTVSHTVLNPPHVQNEQVCHLFVLFI